MTTRLEDAVAGRITIDPAICNGKPTIRGKRITVQTILEFLSAGEDREEILRQYPSNRKTLMPAWPFNLLCNQPRRGARN